MARHHMHHPADPARQMYFRHLPILPFIGALVVVLACCVSASVAQQICSPNIPLYRPDVRYELVAGSTPLGSEVRDRVTGLIWQRCAMGMIWNPSSNTCEVRPPATSAPKVKWTDALDYAKSAPASSVAAGRPWRLPNHAELYSLPERACYGPALNTQFFPNDPVGWFWSSSPHRGNTTMAWIVNTYNGEDYVNNKDYTFFVRLVR